MTFVGCFLVILLFALIIYKLDLAVRAREVMVRSHDSVQLIRDPSIHDDEKEVRLQKESLRLLVLLVQLTGGSLVALLAPIGVIWLLDRIGLMSLHNVLSMLMNWQFILATTVAAILLYVVVKRLKA